MLKLSDFDYQLPPERIAQTPVEPRDTCKLLVVDRTSGALSDHIFRDLSDLLGENDVLVLNNTKVFPARLYGKVGSKNIEILLEKETGLDNASITYEALTKPGLKVGDTVQVSDRLQGVCIAAEDYTRKIRFNLPRESFMEEIYRLGLTPIPPYIKWNEDDEQELREKYQTVFAKKEGAVAAPTAGLHFTKELIKKLEDKGVQIEYVTLHVGLGTFLPVKTDDITSHHMHSEQFELDALTAKRLNEAKDKGKRIIAVGTTVIRVLETCAQNDRLEAKTGGTNIFIYPPYRFKFVDSLITNFHTPKSTLLMLVTALVGGSDFQSSLMGNAYKHAITHDYRFYSFGDAMWIK